MIHISNAYKKAIYGRSDWYPSARVTFLDGTVLNLGRSEFLISGNNIVDGAGTQSLPLGNVVSRKITVKLYNADDRYRVHSFLGAKITLYKSISTDIGDLTIKSGTYTVIDPESYGDTVSFSAYDDAYKLDRDYTTHLTYPLSLKAFCDAMVAHGYKAGIYASTSWYKNYIGQTWGYSLWIASYGSKSAGVDGIDMWQYTSRGSIPGIPGYVDVNYVYKNLGGTAKPVQKPNSTQTTTAKPVDESWKGDKRYYLNNSRVGEWQKAMNKGFDTNALSVDDKFGVGSQNFAKTHILWSGQTHNCITAIRWLRRTLRDVYGFTKLSYNEGWTDYLGKCVEVFQRNRGLTPDRKVGLITTYWLLSGIVK